MQCPTCGTNNAPRALHCEKCGARLADAEPGFRGEGLAAGAVAGATADAADSRLSDSAKATGAAGAASATPPKRARDRRDRKDEEPGWLNGALVFGTAVFAAIALLGIWWNLRAPYVDPAPKAPEGIAVAPFNNGNDAPSAAAPGDTGAGAPNEASAAQARAQALAAIDAAASGAAADVAAASQSAAPLTASAATAALTAAATQVTPPAPSATQSANAPDEMMQLLSRRVAGGKSSQPPTAPSDLPAHYDANDIGAIAAQNTPPASASAPLAASAPSAASTIAAALARCERYRWYEVIPKQRCIWAICNGRWGRDGCPAGANPGESH
ncbi:MULTISPECIES: zinc finger Ran-binding domain-containing protein [Pandoraea]|uniref:Uncharacterized protein n=1 Tax=Pandoraea pnomenusa TaxID=93220 RepID=A0A378YPX7_9BURK|nr:MULTISPECIES: hypothetical protein [Pandoraea]AHB08749.2 hypothetical protein U875_24260 [Pandoraea pnomenusa 3kgm]AHB78461.1 hypothetical protein X636_09875 [Pandoraea pnomenusa]QDH61849.1 hypothetical protein FKQ53_23160 [Pandoraea pnomenusa]QDX23878.1 hypothetical protein FP568_23545 [Pandoraea pnomenusa]SUA78567.1 Uncharacterised protein [Pandoraea pnomenusa]